MAADKSVKQSTGKPTSGKILVVVESPTKAKTIRKFLGKEYVVESCMGHIRDLPQSAKDIPEKYKKQPWANLGVNIDDGFDPLYTVPKSKTKVVAGLKQKLAEASELILATDEDREGESISWHLVETLKPRIPYRRMVFNEITREAIQEALQTTKKIDEDLVRAQEARRVLDRLVGYTISPLLWKKIAYGLSAGRVQSVAVRLIVEREHERIKFKRSEYWDIEAACEKSDVKFTSKLVGLNGKRIATGRDFSGATGKLLDDKKNDVLQLDQTSASKLAGELKGKPWQVIEVEEKPISRKPAAPFITSTLQQEANRKLGLGAREAMQIAQGLYEQGFITYMRTDSTFLSEQALKGARNFIKKEYGADYLPDEPRSYASKKVKGAQEAHEAIRPAGSEFTHPEKTGLKGVQLKLYELIWKRTIASQMVNAQQKQMSVRFEVGQALFQSNGMTIEFAGFLKVYREEEEETDKQDEVRLPKLVKGDKVQCLQLEPLGHETKPPSRFTEASLVQTMEKEGIGRPSTYAAVISTIMDRGYAKKISNALVPTFTAMIVADLLMRYFPQYVDLGFTSEMEKSLDDIAAGEMDWVKYLGSVYLGEKGLRKQVELQDKKIKPEEARSIRLIGMDNYDFRVGRFGAYVCRADKGGEEICTSIPDNQAPADINAEIIEKLIEQKLKGHDVLGKDPVTGLPIFVLNGKYGPYVQLGDAAEEETKPKRVAVPQGIDPTTVDLPTALNILSLPKTLGQHPGTGKDIKAGLGRFGPFVVCDGDFRSIPKTESVLTIGFDRALELLSQPKKSRGRAAALKDFGNPPGQDKPVQLFEGKFGPYLKFGSKNVSVPEDIKVDALTAEKAFQIVGDKVGFSEKPSEDGVKADSKAKKRRPAGKKVTKAKKS